MRNNNIFICFLLSNLLISHVGPVHPVGHVHINSFSCIIGETFVLPSNALLASLIGLMLTGLPIELIPRIPRITTAVVCSKIFFSVSFRDVPSYFVGF